MREIKFRAFYKPLGVMIEPDKLEMINFDTKVLGVYMVLDGKGYHVLRKSDFELMQYTGLKDSVGQEVYEGDIVQGATDIFKNMTGKVTCAGCSYYVDGVEKYSNIREELTRSYKVIGNIYETPELLHEP